MPMSHCEHEDVKRKEPWRERGRGREEGRRTEFGEVVKRSQRQKDAD